MDVVIDTDILSTFCKINKLELLQRLFHRSTIIIAPSVYKEIREAVQSGLLSYSPPARFSRIKLDPAERSLAKEIHERRRLGQGDCECIAISKQRKCLLLTNDQQAQREADSLYIEYISLLLVLRELWKTDIMTRDQTIGLAKEIEDKDKIVIKDLYSLLKWGHDK